MKLINILQILTIAGLLFSCSNEGLIEGPAGGKLPPVTGGASTTNLRLSVGNEITTRSHGNMTTEAETYFATFMEAEKNINNLFVATFAVTEKDGDKIVDGTLLDTEWTDEMQLVDGYYEIRDLTIDFGEIGFLVIANSELMKDASNYEGFETFAEFKALIEENLAGQEFAAEFDPENLVKVGEAIATIEREGYNCDDCFVIVDLYQLAARIDVMLENKVPEDRNNIVRENRYVGFENLDLSKIVGGFQGTLYYTDDDGNQQSIYVNAHNSMTVAEASGTSNYTNFIYIHKGVTYSANNPNGLEGKIKGAKITGLLMESEYTIAKWFLDIPEVTLYNIEANSYIIENANMLSESAPALVNGHKLEPHAMESVNGFLFSFYTYEKPYYYEDLSEVLYVDVETKWENATVLITETYTLPAVAGAWLKSNSTTSFESGWGSGANGFVVLVPPLNSFNPDDMDAESERTSDPVSDTVSTEYRFDINPKEGQYEYAVTVGDGVRRGNLYSSYGVFSTVPQYATRSNSKNYLDMTWMVKPW